MDIFVEIVAVIIGLVLVIYAYLVGKREKLGLTFVEKKELEKIEYKKELARDIAYPILVEASAFLIFGSMFNKFKVISIILLALITLCVYALELKINRSLFKYRKQKAKKIKIKK